MDKFKTAVLVIIILLSSIYVMKEVPTIPIYILVIVANVLTIGVTGYYLINKKD